MSNCNAPKSTPESLFVTVKDGHFYIGDKEYQKKDGMVPFWPVKVKEAIVTVYKKNWI